jgi:F1F0 ATPase subunit 2
MSEKMMSETVWILASTGVGAVVALFYFGLLYATVRRLEDAGRPHLLAIGSFLGRLVVTVVVLFLLMRGGHWERGLAFLVGFVVVRVLLVRRWGRGEPATPVDAGPKRAIRESEKDGPGPGRGSGPAKDGTWERRFEERPIWK